MSFSEALRVNGILHAHIVDDAFDVIPGAALGSEGINTFIQTIEEAQFTQIATFLGVMHEEQAVIANLGTVEGAAKFFPERVKYGEAGEQLFQDFIQATEPEKDRLKPLLEFLRKNGIQCHTFGRRYEITNEPAPQILFVDLKLNEDGIDIREPIAVVRKLKDQYRDTEPIVFLMSTQENSLRDCRDDFRKQCELFSSQFEHLPKRTLAIEISLRRIVEHHVDAYSRVQKMRTFVRSWTRAMQAAQKELVQTMHAFDMSDHFVLHNTAKADGADPGGYILDMLLGYVANEIERSSELHQFAADLNTFSVGGLKRSSFNLQPLVGDIYAANMVHPFARLEADKKRGFAPPQGYLALGDIFFNRDEVMRKNVKTALIVLTPICDLARPTEIEKRKASIFLCEGSVKRLTADSIISDAEDVGATILRFGEGESVQYAITWNKKRVATWAFAEYEQLRSPDSFPWVHAGRLRAMYALQLQHAVLADLGRVGTMRRPAPYLPHRVEVLVPKDGKWALLKLAGSPANDRSSGAIAVDPTSENTTFILNDVLLRDTFDAMATWVIQNNSQPAKALLKQLSECDTALNNLMYFVDTKAEKEKRAKGDKKNIFPLETVGFADADAPLRSAVILAGKTDKDLCIGKDVGPTPVAVLVFRFFP